MESSGVRRNPLESGGVQWNLLDRSTGLCLVGFRGFQWTPPRLDMQIWPMSHSQSLGLGSTGIHWNPADHVGECTVLMNCYLSSDLKWMGLGFNPCLCNFCSESSRFCQTSPADSSGFRRTSPVDSSGFCRTSPADSSGFRRTSPVDSGHQCVTRCHISRIHWNPADHVGECKVLIFS